MSRVAAELRAHTRPDETLDTHVIHLLYVAGLPRAEFRTARAALGIPAALANAGESVWSFSRSNVEVAAELERVLSGKDAPSAPVQSSFPL